MRLFIAIDVPYSEVLSKAYSDLKRTGRGLRPTIPENQHITLKFLGDPGCSIDDVVRSLNDISDLPGPYVMGIDEAGAFPSWKRPSVLWIGMTNSVLMKQMAERIDEELHRAISSPLERRPFKGHMTIARIKGNVNVGVTRDILERMVRELKEEGYSIPVGNFKLISSVLTPDGPKYETLSTHSLNG